MKSRRDFLAVGMLAPAAAPMPFQERKPATGQVPEISKSSRTPELRYRTLGKTGLKVTTVGFGCMTTSDPTVIERAADMGINYFDTARGYQNGNNERMVGAALKSRRNRIYISTKSHAATKDEALKDLDKSLSELGTDHVEVWFLHAKSAIGQVTDELLEAQDIAKKAGKIRFAGVSTHQGQPELIPALVAKGRTDVILSAHNFALDPGVEKAIDAASNAGVGIVAMKVMAGGFRRAKPGDPTVAILKKDGAMQTALKWAIRKPTVHTSIPGIMDLDQLDENFRAMSSPFTESDGLILKAQLDFINPLYCRACGACSGQCKQNLPVSDILRFLMYAEGYGQFSLARERYKELPEDIADSKCGSCSGCSVQCRFGVRVAERVARAQEYFA